MTLQATAESGFDFVLGFVWVVTGNAVERIAVCKALTLFHVLHLVGDSVLFGVLRLKYLEVLLDRFTWPIAHRLSFAADCIAMTLTA